MASNRTGNEVAFAEVFEQLNEDTIVDLLLALYRHTDWTHSIEEEYSDEIESVTLSPFVVLAHFKDKEQRTRIIDRLDFMGTALGVTLNRDATLDRYSAEDRVGSLLGRTYLQQRYDAETIAMFLDKAVDHKEEYLQLFDDDDCEDCEDYDMNRDPVTRKTIEAAISAASISPPAIDLSADTTELKSRLENDHLFVGSRLNQLAQQMHRKGATTEAAYAKVIGQLNDETIVAFLTHISEQNNFLLFEYDNHEVTLSPFMILAHLEDLNQRDRIFSSSNIFKDLLGILTSSDDSLDEHPANGRISTFTHDSILDGRLDAKTYAMVFDQVMDASLQEALLSAVAEQEIYDLHDSQITRENIEAAMKKNWKGLAAPKRKSVPLTLEEDGLVAGAAGVGTLAVTAVAITAMILTSRLWFGVWETYPTYRGIYPVALMATVGYGVGKIATGSDEIGFVAAFILGTFASPKVSKLIFSSHKMSYWHGAGFSIAGILPPMAIKYSE